MLRLVRLVAWAVGFFFLAGGFTLLVFAGGLLERDVRNCGSVLHDGGCEIRISYRLSLLLAATSLVGSGWAVASLKKLPMLLSLILFTIPYVVVPTLLSNTEPVDTYVVDSNISNFNYYLIEVYGFPLRWYERVECVGGAFDFVCGGFGPWKVNWAALSLDVAFYSSVGYAIVLPPILAIKLKRKIMVPCDP